jgi:hypothetical protein
MGESKDAGERPWLTLSEAAARSGRHIGALRSLVRRGRLPARKGNGGAWLVQLPDDPMAEPEVSSGSSIGSTSGDAVAELMAEVAELREQLARAEVEREAARAVATAEITAAKDRTAAQVAAAEAARKAELAAFERLVQELKTMLAEARRPWWRRWIR